MRCIRTPLLLIPALTATALLGGCTVGPGFHRPKPPPVGRYRPAGESRPIGPTVATAERHAPAGRRYGQRIVPGARGNPKWWTLFRSEALDALVRRALLDNHDLAAARAAFAQAQQLVIAQAGPRYPQVGLTVQAERQKYGALFLGPNVFPAFSAEGLTGSVSYLLDYDGALRRSVEQEQALAQYQRSEVGVARLGLTGSVASEVVVIAITRAEIHATARLLAEDRDNLALVRTAYANGSVSRLDVLTARSQLATDQTLLPPLYQQLSSARHALAVLLGSPPADWTQPDIRLRDLTLPRSIPVSVPSQLVRQRPDILAAEAQLHAATAAVGVATANLYPQIALTASLSRDALRPARLFDASATAWSLIASLTQPLYEGGRLRAERRAALDALQVAAQRYQQVVLQSFEQVADLLDAIDHDALLLAAQANARNTSQMSLELARESYRAGNSGVLQVLDAQRERQRAELGYLRAQGQQYLDTVQLLLAVGGSALPAGS